MSVAVGVCGGLYLGTALAKTTSAWVAGAGGALDTGAIANSTWYHWYLIKNLTTGVVDAICSLSASAPTYPAGYTVAAYLGSGKTDGSAKWISFIQVGDKFLWKDPVLDANSVTAGATTAQLVTLTVPTGLKVEAIFSSIVSYGGSSANYTITAPDQTDNAPSGTFRDGVVTSTITQSHLNPTGIHTDTSARVRYRFSAADAVYEIHTKGWSVRRGRVY
jgi:uncharacterized protein YwbE